MKTKILFLFLLMFGMYMKAQTYKKLLITTNSGEEVKLKNAVIDEKNNTIMYQVSGQTKYQFLNDISSIKSKKGSYWLEYMVGGLIGSTASVLAFKNDDTGHIGTMILSSTLVTTIIGVFVPKYEIINLEQKKEKLTYNGLGLKYEF